MGYDDIPAWVEYKGSCGCKIVYKASQLHLSECKVHGHITLKIVKESGKLVPVKTALSNRKKGHHKDDVPA